MKKRGFLICALVFSISVITLGAIFFLNAPQYLSSPASEPRNSDVILILGGDDDVRIIRGLELYKQGFAKKVILPCYLNRPIAAAEFNSNKFVRMFISAGAGKQDIYFEPVSKNTWEEGVNTLPLMKEHGWQSVIIVSDPPHMRRIQWVWNKVTKDTPVHYTLVATSPEWWLPGKAPRWWQNRQEAEAVKLEYLKLLYYRFAH